MNKYKKTAYGDNEMLAIEKTLKIKNE